MFLCQELWCDEFIPEDKKHWINIPYRIFERIIVKFDKYQSQDPAVWRQKGSYAANFGGKPLVHFSDQTLVSRLWDETVFKPHF